jgi:hypothetical protein
MMKHTAYNLMSMLHRDVWFTQQGYTTQMDMYETKFNFKMNLTSKNKNRNNRELLTESRTCSGEVTAISQRIMHPTKG